MLLCRRSSVCNWLAAAAAAAADVHAHGRNLHTALACLWAAVFWPSVQVIDLLVSQAGPGQSHEHTLLLVLGDHGQTSTGDHGGGTPEEADSALFALHMGAHKQRLDGTALSG